MKFDLERFIGDKITDVAKLSRHIGVSIPTLNKCRKTGKMTRYVYLALKDKFEDADEYVNIDNAR